MFINTYLNPNSKNRFLHFFLKSFTDLEFFICSGKVFQSSDPA